MSLHLRISTLALLGAFLAGAGPLPAGEEKKGGLGGLLDRAKAVQGSVDFGPLDDGAEKSQPEMVKEGWTYLFDGRIPAAAGKWSPLGLWRLRVPNDPDRNLWSVIEEDGQYVLRNIVPEGKHGTDLISLPDFWDFDLHVEVRLPAEGSNSGVYLRGRYEIQVLGTPPAVEKPGAGDMGAIYGVAAPSSNAALGPGKWQAIDASIRGFKVTVHLNGKVIQDNVEIPADKRNGTGSELSVENGAVYAAGPDAPGPIFLQGDHGSVDFRNIRIRPTRSVGEVLQQQGQKAKSKVLDFLRKKTGTGDEAKK